MAESNIEILDRVINRDYPKCDVLYSWQALKKELSGGGQNSAKLTKIVELVKPIVWAYNHGKPTLNKDLKALALYCNVNSLPGGETNTQSDKSCDYCADPSEAEHNICEACLDRLIRDGA